MLTFHVERLADGLEEIKPLLPKHYAELALNQEKVPLSPQYHVYLARESAGELVYITMRDAGELKGYFLGFVAPGLHYSTCLTCTMDIFWISPDKRGAAMPGVKLFRFVEKELKRRGVDRWFVGSKCKADASKLFEFLGFNRVEIYYSKMLED